MLWTLLVRYAKPYSGLIVVVVLLQFVATMTTLYLPSLNARIIDEGVAVGDTDFIWRTGWVMLAVALLQLVSAVAAVWFSAKAAMGLGRDLRAAVYRKVDGFSEAEVNRFGAATLITRNTNDVQQVQMVMLMTLNFMVMVPIMSIGGIIMAVREDAGLSWLVWASVPVLLTFVIILVTLLMPLFQTMQKNIDSVNGVLREQIMGIRVVRAFTREDHETRRFAGANRALTDTSLSIGKLFVLMDPMIMLILHGATAAVLWFGGLRVADGLVEVGSLTAFMQYLLQILMAVMMGTFMFMMLPRAVVSARRLGDVLTAAASMIEPAAPRTPQIPAGADAPAGTVEFREVAFAFPGADAPVLTDISFTAEAGATTAIIGSTGAGKTSLLNLIPRLHDTTAGEVLIDGVPVDELPRPEITDAVGLVPQKPYLFSGTVADNLKFGAPESDDEQMWAALRVAQADEFVAERTTGSGQSAAHGLDSGISQGGTNVSGGQRQRLCIARALVAQPRIYLFDDSFSALDVTTDAKLRAALDSSTHGATVIMVAQRVSTITDADQIIVLEEGRIVGRGTHDELLHTSEVYREIVDSQITVQDLA